MNIKVELDAWNSFEFFDFFFKLGYYFLFDCIILLIFKKFSELLLSFDSCLAEKLSEYTWLTCIDCIKEHLSILLDTFIFTTCFTKFFLMRLSLNIFVILNVVFHSGKFSKIVFFLKIFDNLHWFIQRFIFKIFIRIEVQMRGNLIRDYWLIENSIIYIFIIFNNWWKEEVYGVNHFICTFISRLIFTFADLFLDLFFFFFKFYW